MAKALTGTHDDDYADEHEEFDNEFEEEVEDDIEVINFTSPDKPKTKAKAKLKVDLVGVTYEIHRPKDATLFLAQSAVADSANEADRWMTALNLIETCMTPQDRKHFLDRACDRQDPLTAGAVWEMIGELLARWEATNKIPASKPIVIGAHPDAVGLTKPVRIVEDELGLDLVCHPPKDLILGITSSAIAASANPGQQSWCINLFLDAALNRPDALRLAMRLKAPSYVDELDLGTIASVVQTLIEKWYPSNMGTRAQRRAVASRNRKATKRKAGAKTKADMVQASFLDEQE